MKNLNILLIVGYIFTLGSINVVAQANNSGDRNNVSLNIPDRFKKIGQEFRKHIYKDPKTEAIFSFEKVDSYVFENLLGNQINKDMKSFLSNSGYVNVVESKISTHIGDGYVVDFQERNDEGELNGNSHRIILLDVNGTLYRYRMLYLTDNRKNSFQLLDKILDNSDPLYKESYFSN